MIKFRRDDNMSIFLFFDRVGVTELLNAMQVADTDSASESIQIEFDKSVITVKRNSQTVIINLIVEKGKETEIKSESNHVVWRLSPEDLKCALTRFGECLSTGTFSPPEFIRTQVHKNRKLDYVYCEMVEERMEV